MAPLLFPHPALKSSSQNGACYRKASHTASSICSQVLATARWVFCGPCVLLPVQDDTNHSVACLGKEGARAHSKNACCVWPSDWAASRVCFTRCVPGKAVPTPHGTKLGGYCTCPQPCKLTLSSLPGQEEHPCLSGNTSRLQMAQGFPLLEDNAIYYFSKNCSRNSLTREFAC